MSLASKSNSFKDGWTPRNRALLGVLLLLISDIAVTAGVYALAFFLRTSVLPLIVNTPYFLSGIGRYVWILPIWLATLAMEGGYSRRFTVWDELKCIWKSVFFVAMMVFALVFVGKAGVKISRAFIFVLFVLIAIAFPVTRPLCKRLLYRVGLLKRKLLIIGTGSTAKSALSILRREKNLGYDIAGLVGEKPEGKKHIDGAKVHGFVGRVEKYIEKCGVQDVLIADPSLEKQALADLVNRIQQKAENVLYLLDISGVAVLGTELRHFFDEENLVMEIKNNLARPLNYLTKKTLDFVFGFVLLIILAVPLLVISLLVKATSKGPVIFRQPRIGKDGKVFSCYKFRTMYLDAEKRLHEILAADPAARKQWETYWKLDKDPRVTSFGRFLREFSLDELPQLFNVLKGEMSIVGPRPYLPRERGLLREFEGTILSVTPGITGFWQVSGRNETTFRQRLALDKWYVRNWNLWLDIVILIKTLKVVAIRQGAK
ncbi:MAG: undecaprenyl-phosphate galactose phosphotransferase WbaP [Nitrospiraceae bacterium]|nr:undecaprenyl-phosphate galactose phosphotransferase WbaP [Nitrospiraceae bacterium]